MSRRAFFDFRSLVVVSGADGLNLSSLVVVIDLKLLHRLDQHGADALVGNIFITLLVGAEISGRIFSTSCAMNPICLPSAKCRAGNSLRFQSKLTPCKRLTTDSESLKGSMPVFQRRSEVV